MAVDHDGGGDGADFVLGKRDYPRAAAHYGDGFGAASGLVALYLEVFSMPLMLVWCAVVMFVCGVLALGKRPYMGLLIGITLAVVCGAGPGDMNTALWRSGDVIIGSLLALLFTSIFTQKRLFTGG